MNGSPWSLVLGPQSVRGWADSGRVPGGTPTTAREPRAVPMNGFVRNRRSLVPGPQWVSGKGQGARGKRSQPDRLSYRSGNEFPWTASTLLRWSSLPGTRGLIAGWQSGARRGKLHWVLE